MCVLMVSCRSHRMSASPMEMFLVLWNILKTVGDDIKATKQLTLTSLWVGLQCLTELLLVLANLGFLSDKKSCLGGWVLVGF